VSLQLRVVAGNFAVAQLSADAEIPSWMPKAGFSAIVRADDELTVVCLEEFVPVSVRVERGWACFRSVGPFDFQTAGVVHSLIAPLSSNGIGVFVICTFDGEHILIKNDNWYKAQKFLEAVGHHFIDAV
jgi:uncharacterized protein